MISRDDTVLLDILKACRLAIEFLGDMDRTAFVADAKTQAAVIHEILVIGEASKRLTPEFKDRVTGVPWRAIAGMRDKLIHHYDVVNPEAVPLTAPRHRDVLPGFRCSLRSILE